MDKTDDYIANRLTWKAGKHNFPTMYSLFYKDLSTDIQQYLNTYINKDNSGQPVLFFTKPTNEWTLVCTKEIICNDNKTVFRLKISDIEELRPTELYNCEKNGVRPNPEIQKKSEFDQLTVTDKSNNFYVLHANKGSDLYALWNILLMAKRLQS